MLESEIHSQLCDEKDSICNDLAQKRPQFANISLLGSIVTAVC